MAYSLLIVDDEKTTLESLGSLVRWNDLGFQVVGLLDDGRKAIETLRQRPVDVVLTDIRMTFESGIEVARYVHDGRLPTKVVLISGYREFEYARQAIECEVAHFLPKPASMKEIEAVFRDLRARLDAEERARASDRERQGSLRAMRDTLLAAFFHDLLLGALTSREGIAGRFGPIDPGLSLERACFAVVRTRLPERRDGDSLASFFLAEGEEDSAVNPPALAALNAWSFVSVRSEDEVVLCLLDRGGRTPREFAAAVDAHVAALSRGIGEVLGPTVRTAPCEVHPNVLRFVQRRGAGETRWTGGAAVPPGGEDALLERERRKLLVSLIEQGDGEPARELFDSLFSRMAGADLRLLKDRMVTLFSLLAAKMEEHGVPAAGLFEAAARPGSRPPRSYADILASRDGEEARRVGHAFLARLLAAAADGRRRGEPNAIRRAQDYIRESLSADISLETVADAVFLSPIYLSRLFKEKTGENFVHYLTRLRMERARELLADPAHRIFEVAAMAGYRNARYFCRLFKRATGSTPTEYRGRLGIPE